MAANPLFINALRPESQHSSVFKSKALNYIQKLEKNVELIDLDACYKLAYDLYISWNSDNKIFICGNGGSSANAMHIANDFHYGVGASDCDENARNGLRVEALTGNSSILTCLANDIGYENIFSHQLSVNGSPGDILIALSGSGNSKNIINAIEMAKSKEIKSYAILGFDGGECLKIASHSIHVPTDDMQIAEDIQLIIGHLCMQWLNSNKPT